MKHEFEVTREFTSTIKILKEKLGIFSKNIFMFLKNGN